MPSRSASKRASDVAPADAARPGACHADRGPHEFWVRIIAKERRGPREDTLAFAELDDALSLRSAAVLYGAILRVASRYRVSAGTILGAVIAHEVGHLILGADAHAALGLLSANWNESHFRLMTFSHLGFDTRQAKRLRETLTLRATRTTLTPSAYSVSVDAIPGPYMGFSLLF